MKIYFTILASLFLAFNSQARLKQLWSYDKLTDKATLIVVATPTKVVETSKLAALPNIATVQSDGTTKPVMGKGVETTFDALTVLKGERNTKTFTLDHFKLAKQQMTMNGPDLVAFEPKDQKRYLMFLVRETDDRYVAVSGQTDPGDAIKEIVGRYP